MMQTKLTERIGFLRSLRTGTLDAPIQEVLSREEENGAKALLYFRIVFFMFFVIGGLTASPNGKDIASNMFFAGVYGCVVVMQFLLIRSKRQRALHRFNYFLILADHALFTLLLIFYYSASHTANFNHAMKSPYFVILIIPTLTTLIQFRHTLLFFSSSVLLLVVFGFFAFAHLSGAPQTTNWTHYILGDAIILSAWLGVWVILALTITTLVAYAVFRSIRMVSQIGRSEAQRGQLARYFSPAVVDEIFSTGAEVKNLETSEKQSVAVLFADIRSFTTMSENMPPHEIAALLTELRQMQMKAVFNYNGMVDKFVGDAIMAVFGVPHSSGSYATDVQNAVKAGVEMRRSLASFNEVRRSHGKEDIRIGIGIHAGEVFAGNLGGEGQLEYTVIGDTVNTASRIEHLCKKAQADFLISESVARELDAIPARTKIGLVRIRGREKPMEIYKVI